LCILYSERVRATRPFVFVFVFYKKMQRHVVVVEAARAYVAVARGRAAAFSTDTWAGVAIMALGAALALQCFLVARHLASEIMRSWAATFFPSWCIDAALGAALVAYLLLAAPDPNSDSDADDLRDSKIKAASALVLLAMVFASEVMLCNKLDGREAHSWHAVAGPLYAGAASIVLFGASIAYHNWPDEATIASNSNFIDSMA
jgi:hypothetical protein